MEDTDRNNMPAAEEEYVPIPIVDGEDLEIYDPIYTDLFQIMA